MATSSTKTDEVSHLAGVGVPDWATRNDGADSADEFREKPTQLDALQALLAFSALHDQIRRRRALGARSSGFDAPVAVAEFEAEEQFVLDEVLQLVAQRAVAITGADGLAIALAENNEIVLRAAAGTICPDLGQRIDRNSSFSGACFRTAQIFNCDDTETDSRVNLEACRKLGARSMVAVPLCGRRRVIGVIEAFCSWPFGFNDSDVRNLTLLAELVLAALKPEDEDRFAESAEVAEKKLEKPKAASAEAPPIEARRLAETQRAEPAKAANPVAQSAATAQGSSVSSAQSSPLASAQNSSVASAQSPITSAQSPVAVPAALRAGADEASGPTQAGSSHIAAQFADSSVQSVSSTQTEASLQQDEPHLVSRRQWMLVLLVCIVVGSAFAAGVWWKLKSAQIGSQMVQTSPLPQTERPAPGDSTTQAVTASTGTNSAPSTSSPAPSEAAVPAGSSSTPQEVSKYPKVTGVRHWSSADSSTIVLDLEDQVQYEPGHLSNPDRFYFDLRDTQLAAELQGKSFDGDSLLSRIRIAQPAPGMTRVVLEARPGASLSRPQVSLERDPYRLVIEVSKAGASPKGAVNLFPNAPETEKNKLAIVIPPPTKEDLQLKARVPKLRIAVDAGHGGWDLGTVGRRGLLEKDLVLEIAQRLGKLLENRLGSEVIYTRPDDNYIPLDDRAQIANQAQADLFISVHANYSDLPSARGVETYYTNFFSAPGSKEATLQNVDTSSMAGSLKNSVTPSLSPSELRERIDQSRRLAASVQRSLYGTLAVQNPGLRDRGVKEAGFVVLTESAMPGILAEVSFVSSPADEQKLQSDGYREKIAEALYKGIARYAISSRGVKMAAKQVASRAAQ
jgi:N-acetylmuramoyl-L-alanine amidase/putative methionine-R-sulfoxide reductase with GAF domain